MTKRQMNIRNSVRKEICIWLEANDGEFTSDELAELLGKDVRRVSTELCFLSKESVVQIVGSKGRYHIYQAGTAADVVEYKKPGKMGTVLPPGVLGITTHTMDRGIERVSF